MPKQSAGGEQTSGLYSSPETNAAKLAPREERSRHTIKATSNIHLGNLVADWKFVFVPPSLQRVLELSQTIFTKTPTRGFIDREERSLLQSALLANQV